MINLQNEFLEFHDVIKLSFENEDLRSKRDILLERLNDNITDDAPSFTYFNQGSYAMHTGIKPENGDYDIDVGLDFSLSRSDYPDPVDVKKWVYDALDGHTKKVEIRRSCVTVTYQKNGEQAFHVDFACYADEDKHLFIAKGKENSDDEHRYWEASDPHKLIELVNKHFENKEDQAQFRRIIRYIKKWKNKHFEEAGNSAPTGISLTALAYELFSPCYQINTITNKRTYDDFQAFCSFVEKIKTAFVFSYDSQTEQWYHRISQSLFVEPGNDLFEKMTVNQQEEFYSKICKMQDKLAQVEKKTKRSEACSVLVEIFGEDFPVKTDRSYVGHSESA